MDIVLAVPFPAKSIGWILKTCQVTAKVGPAWRFWGQTFRTPGVTSTVRSDRTQPTAKRTGTIRMDKCRKTANDHRHYILHQIVSISSPYPKS